GRGSAPPRPTLARSPLRRFQGALRAVWPGTSLRFGVPSSARRDQVCDGRAQAVGAQLLLLLSHLCGSLRRGGRFLPAARAAESHAGAATGPPPRVPAV